AVAGRQADAARLELAAELGARRRRVATLEDVAAEVDRLDVPGVVDAPGAEHLAAAAAAVAGERGDAAALAVAGGQAGADAEAAAAIEASSRATSPGRRGESPRAPAPHTQRRARWQRRRCPTGSGSPSATCSRRCAGR